MSEDTVVRSDSAARRLLWTAVSFPVAVLGGIVVGGVFYIGLLGPWLLP